MNALNPREVAAVVHYLAVMGEGCKITALDLTEGFKEFDCRKCAKRFLDDMVFHRILNPSEHNAYELHESYWPSK